MKMQAVAGGFRASDVGSSQLICRSKSLPLSSHAVMSRHWQSSKSGLSGFSSSTLLQLGTDHPSAPLHTPSNAAAGFVMRPPFVTPTFIARSCGTWKDSIFMLWLCSLLASSLIKCFSRLNPGATHCITTCVKTVGLDCFAGTSG